jgi:ABA DEFICIENT 4-like
MVEDVMLEQLFRLANGLALLGWTSLALGLVLRVDSLRTRIAGLGVPVVLSVGYTAILAAHWGQGNGNFSTLAGVTNLFQSPWLLLAGWVHYLAFDLFVGAWVTKDAEARGAPRWALVPVLPAVFMFGPAGFLLWQLLRASFFTAFQPHAEPREDRRS